MRKNLLHYWHKELSYEIREIVEIAKKIETFWKEISWENIWDPVAKWEKMPDFVKKIIAESLWDDKIFWYSPSKGLDKTREYIASKTKNLDKNNIIFFNGIWEAINKTYGYLAMTAKVLWPNPAYPTHSSAEATNSWSEHLTYNLDPNNDWNPNLEEIENKVKYNPNITWILVINPDNPTWAIFKKEILEGIIDIAKIYDMFVIFDEIYTNLVYDEKERVLLSEIIWDVPWISMKWMSKDVPWPGWRCGWIEVYNKEKDETFSKYIDSIYASKMLEVCSTTMPQYVLPMIYESPEFKPYLKERIEIYKKKAEKLEEYLKDVESIIYVKPKGAFYATIVFKEDKINLDFEIKFENKELWEYIKSITTGKRFDKKFCYNLLAETWICVVPLSWFNSTYNGFRMTLLEQNEEKFENILKNLKEFILKISK
jgi:alanine-synthesizing transaminase